MKKLTAMILALVLALSLGCAAFAETADESGITENNWLLKTLTDTGWIAKESEATLDIKPTMDENATDQFIVTVHWSNSAENATEWNFYGNFNWESKMLTLVEEYCYDVTYGEDGEMELTTSLYDRACDVTLALDEDGQLVLRGSENDQIALMPFDPVPEEGKLKPVTDSQAELFKEATDGLLGVNYEPVGLIDEADDQVFLFLCQGSVVYPNATPIHYLALVTATGEEGPRVQFVQLMDDGSDG